MKSTRTLGLMFALAIGLSLPAFGQTSSPVQYNVASASKVWFDGTSTLHSFSAKSGSVIGTVETSRSLAVGTTTMKDDSICEATVSIPVRTLDSGEKGLNDNMYKAMKADDHPDIEYKLLNSEINAVADTVRGALPFKTTGELTIAGSQKEIQMDARLSVSPDGKLELTGSKSILMSDFGIQPPTMMFGVIKTGDKVVVHFDLLLTPTQSATFSER